MHVDGNTYVGGGGLVSFADGMCTPSRVSYSPLSFSTRYQKNNFSAAGCQKGYFVRVSCYFFIFLSTF